MEIRKIVITGGPCAGKTTALSWIQNALTKAGYTVLFVPETATELISGGVAPWTCGSNKDFQRGQLRLQAVKEEIFEAAARTMPQEKILIVCDRGIVDNHAYMTDEEFYSLLADMGKTEVEVRDGYDAVFHLVTAADGAAEFYSDETNAARYETAEEAIALDKRLLASWVGHPHLRVIDNSTGFDAKLKRLIYEISSFLGEPVPMEIERKYLIRYPDLDWLNQNPNCRKVDIVQTYLIAPEGEELRLRQRGENGSYMYFMTAKRKVNELKRVEVEERLTEGQYLDLLKEADPEKNAIHKTRYYMTYDNQYFEIDLYPFWDDVA
ncbi:MAG: AAA family ATPase, partial [Solobacterium sp.]|nr:AAA family ATPase [Solobacterium sp.]